jgi:dynein heavy chain 1
VIKLLKMQQLEDEEELAYSTETDQSVAARSTDGRPAWMRTLYNSATTWLHLLPTSLLVTTLSILNTFSHPLFVDLTSHLLYISYIDAI